MEVNLIIIQSFDDLNGRVIDIINLKLNCEKRVEKTIMENLFCSLCNQVLVNPLMPSHVLTNGHFAKVIRLVRKTFSSCKFYDVFVQKELFKLHVSIRDQ